MSSIFSTPELALGIAVGGAAGAAFEPKLEVPKQSAWARNPQRLPDVGLLAALVAGGKISQTDGRNMAARLGFDQGPFDSLTWLAQDRLSFPIMLRMWRLAAVNPNFDEKNLAALFDKTIAHEQLDWDYAPYLRSLKNAELIGIGDIAYGVVRGILPDEGMLPVPPPTSGTSVPRFEPSTLSPVDLAAALGYDKEQLRILVGRSGLSMAPGLAAQAHFRKIINAEDYTLAIAEGDLRTEWAAPLLEATRQIPTAGEFMENALRGWRTKTEGENGAALHGMTQEHAALIYQNRRRPLNPHAIKQALARGANFNPEAGEIQDPYSASVHQADLGPEWYEMAVALQGSYPPLFQVNRLVTAGIIDADTGADWMRKAGEADEVVTALHRYWSLPTGAAADKDIASAATKLKTAAHKSYIANEISDATATTALEAAGVGAATVPAVLNLWKAERDLIRKSLSATQIRKAVSSGAINPATNAAWTTAEAITRLLELGYDAQDAQTFMEEG